MLAITARRELEKLIVKRGEYLALESNETRRLLVELARKGRELFEILVIDQGALGASLAAAERLQIVSVNIDAFLPIEFAYERQAPRQNAKLCPNARQALQDGKCAPTCPADDGSHVCPIAFWCLRKVIERYPFDPHAARALRMDYSILAEPGPAADQLGPIRGVVCAASDLVNAEAVDRVAQLGDALSRVTGSQSVLATDWDAWRRAVEQHKPALLDALPHTLFKAKEAGLEIGQRGSQPLYSPDFRDAYVRASQQEHPVDLLLGCATASRQDVIGSFVPKFGRYGAAIVVATLSKIMGRHAARVAEELVQAIVARAASSDATFGDAMLEVRRSLLAAGVPMALTLVTYGDADWRLGGGSA